MELSKNSRTLQKGGIDLSHFENELISYAQTEGKQAGLKNLPQNVEQFRVSIFNYVESHGQECINKSHAGCSPISGAVAATALRKKADDAIAKLSTDLHESEHRIRQCENEKQQLQQPCDSWLKRNLPKIVIGCISFAEGWFIYEAVRNSGFPVLPAFILSTALGAGLAYFTHIAAGWIKKSGNRTQLIKRTLTTLIPVALLFIYVGAVRSEAYQEVAALTAQAEQAAPVHTASGWKIGMISFILYCIGLVIAIKYAKTKEEKDQEAAYDQACTKLNEEKQKREAVQQKIQAIEEDTHQQVKEALATYEQALARERQIQLICKKALEGYAATNMRHRTDGVCPPFFSNLPQLQFTSLFTHANKSKQNTE